MSLPPPHRCATCCLPVEHLQAELELYHAANPRLETNLLCAACFGTRNPSWLVAPGSPLSNLVRMYNNGRYLYPPPTPEGGSYEPLWPFTWPPAEPT